MNKSDVIRFVMHYELRLIEEVQYGDIEYSPELMYGIVLMADRLIEAAEKGISKYIDD